MSANAYLVEATSRISVLYKSKVASVDPAQPLPTDPKNVPYEFRLGGHRVAQPGDAKELAAFVTWPTFHRWLNRMRAAGVMQHLICVQVDAMCVRDQEITSAILTIIHTMDGSGAYQTRQIHLEQDRAYFILELSSAGSSHAILLTRTSPHEGKGWDLPSVELRHEDLYTMTPEETTSFVQASVPRLESVRSALMVNAWMDKRHGIPKANLAGHYLYASVSSPELHPLDAREPRIEPLQRTDEYWVVPAEKAWSYVRSPASREALLLYLVGVKHPYIIGGSPLH